LIRAAGEIAVIYTLKEVEAEEPDGKAAFFDSAESTIWLVPNDANEGDEHFEALSEALQEHFGPETLREFTHDLFRKGIEKAEVKWRKLGLMSRREVLEEPPLAHSSASNSRENSTADVEPVASTAENGGEDTGQSENAQKSSGEALDSTTHANADMKGVKPAPFGHKLNDALNKPGKAPESPQAPERSPVSNPARRREQTEKDIAADREKEPQQSERQKVLPRTVWESKNSHVRNKLKEWYDGKCQICSETFRKRDGSNYFEACYLVRRTAEGAAWLDRVGNVLCLCADCSAKFQFGPIESTSDIQKKIADLKLVQEGGTQPHTVAIQLCGKNVTINFDERHLIDLQSMLKADLARTKPACPTGPPNNQSPSRHLIQCPHCRSKVRDDRLVKHIRDVHLQQSRSTHRVSLSSVQSRRCKRGCGRPALSGADYCSRCM
jgi:hypothetical protein